MSGSDATDLATVRTWVPRRARTPRDLDRLVLTALMGGGTVAIARFFDFWFRAEHIANTAMFVVLSLAIWYGVSRIVLGWIAVYSMRAPEHVPARPDLTVAIFTTSSPGEPLPMFERTLAACAKIRYPHTTYLGGRVSLTNAVQRSIPPAPSSQAPLQQSSGELQGTLLGVHAGPLPPIGIGRPFSPPAPPAVETEPPSEPGAGAKKF